MQHSSLNALSFLLTFYLIHFNAATLLDGIVTLSWLPFERMQLIDRFLSNQTRIQLKLRCQELGYNGTVTKEQIRSKLSNLDKTVKDTTIKISGRIGRVKGCLPLQPNTLSTKSQMTPEETLSQHDTLTSYYEGLWRTMERRTFEAHQSDCDDSGTHFILDKLSDIIPAELSEKEMIASLEKKTRANQSSKEKKKNFRRRRRAANNPTGDSSSTGDLGSSPLALGVRSSTGIIMTWGDGYYFIEINAPEIESNERNPLFDVDVIVSMKNRHGGYITADEYPALIFYGVMCALYALFALLWFIWCAFYWRELLKIQFWIGGVILIGMIEKSAFLAEYDTLNRNGYKVHYAIVTAEVLSCLKRTVSRMLVIIVALGYGIVKPRLGPLKQKVLGVGLFYFSIATTEAMLRINTKNDETNRQVLISRLPLALIDAMIYYWIFTGLVSTTRQLRSKRNVVKLSVYQNFTTTLLVAIVISLLFMIWSLKSRFFTTCLSNWNEFWLDDAFWHILFSLILLVIMILFRPSNNNQRYAFVPLLDQSDRDDDSDNDQENNESPVFDSITIRKGTSFEMNSSAKGKKTQQNELNRESNVSSSNGRTNPSVEDALNWVENNIPTSLADQALQGLDSEEEIINTKLERSKMQ